MIDIAARATNGVIVPNRKTTRREIMNLFKKNLSNLRERLNVSDASWNGFLSDHQLEFQSKWGNQHHL
jgi:hypothetical protein